MLPLLLRALCFFNDPATTEIYTLSLHDALPISATRIRRDPGDDFARHRGARAREARRRRCLPAARDRGDEDRKSTRLNSSHMSISYAVFCLKKKKKRTYTNIPRRNRKHRYTLTTAAV